MTRIIITLLLLLALPLSHGQGILSLAGAPPAASSSVTRVSLATLNDLANSGSANVNINASADGVVVLVCGREGTLSTIFSSGVVTIGGYTMTYRGGVGDLNTQSVGIFTHTTPNVTGASVALTWNWDGAAALSSGGRIYVIGVDGVNQTTPHRSVGGAASATGVNLTFAATALTGDLILALGASFGTGAETWVLATQIQEDALTDITAHIADSAPTGNVTVEFDTVDTYQGLGVIVLQP